MGASSLLDQQYAIVLFDTNCLLCNKTVQVLLKADIKQRLKFAGLSSSVGREVLERFSIDSDSVVLYYKGKTYIKSNAFFVMARILGFPYSLFLVFKIIPVRIADIIYDWIAKNRINWFGRTDQCLIPQKKYTDRIIL